jgi:hypothetical protein
LILTAAFGKVIYFWRLHNIIKSTSRQLRQQIIIEKGRLEREVKSELDSIYSSESKKRELVGSPRVDLAEQIEKLRAAQQQLELFLNRLLAQSAPAPPQQQQPSSK